MRFDNRRQYRNASPLIWYSMVITLLLFMSIIACAVLKHSVNAYKKELSLMTWKASGSYDVFGSNRSSQEDLASILNAIRKRIHSLKAKRDVSFDLVNNSLVIRISESELFVKGSSVISASGRVLLAQIAKEISTSSCDISVRAYIGKDDLRSSSESWVNAAKLAARIADVIASGGMIERDRFEVVSYGSIRSKNVRGSVKYVDSAQRIEVVLRCGLSRIHWAPVPTEPQYSTEENSPFHYLFPKVVR